MNEQEQEQKRIVEIDRAHELADALSKCMNKNTIKALAKSLDAVYKK